MAIVLGNKVCAVSRLLHIRRVDGKSVVEVCPGFEEAWKLLLVPGTDLREWSDNEHSVPGHWCATCCGLRTGYAVVREGQIIHQWESR